MKFFLVLAAFLALSSASHGKKDYTGTYNRNFVQGEGTYDKYHGVDPSYGQQKGLGYGRYYAPFFQGRPNVYDYYGNNDYYGNKDYYYGNKDYYYGNKDHYYGNKDFDYYGNKDHYYGNKDYYYGNKDYYYGNKDHYYGNKDFDYYGNKDHYYGNKDYYYGNKDFYYGNKDYYYDNVDSTTPYYNPLLNQVARQGFYNQYENIVPYNYEYFNQVPSVFQRLYKGYYPTQYSYGRGYGYGYGLNYPSTYQYGRQYEPMVPRQIAY